MDTPSTTSARRSPGWLLAACGLGLLALLGGLLLGQRTADAVDRVSSPVDVGFVQDMKVHHAQAVQMASVLHRRTADQELGVLALDILTTQQGQIGIMTGWLELWQQPQRGTGPVMAWMGEEHAGHMPGMASPEELASLEALPPGALEEQFLRLMIRHHRGAVPMAGHAAEHGSSDNVVRLAGKMAAGQEGEIGLMQDLLRLRGLDPEPEPEPGEHGSH